MSTVNLAEALIRIRDRQPLLYQQLEERLLTSGIRFIAPTVAQAQWLLQRGGVVSASLVQHQLVKAFTGPVEHVDGLEEGTGRQVYARVQQAASVGGHLFPLANAQSIVLGCRQADATHQLVTL